MFIDFLNLIFFVAVVGFAILYFIAGDNFENFKNIMQSLAPFGLFGLIFLAVVRFNREKKKKRLAEGNSDIEIHLSFFDKTKVELFIFSLPMIVCAVAWFIDGRVAMSDFIIACVIFIIASLFRWWLFSKEEV